MPDFPGTMLAPPLTQLSSTGSTSMAMDACVSAGSVLSGLIWISANQGIFVPVWVDQHVTVYQMAVYVVTQSGNLDVGIYDEAGVALVRAGSTAVAAAGVQTLNVTDTPLAPGTYYLALACDNTTAAFRGTGLQANVNRAAGMRTMASAFSGGLVATATYAASATAYLPLITASLVATI